MTTPGALQQNGDPPELPSLEQSHSNGAIQLAADNAPANLRAIQEGKQKAREVMAAAGGTPGTPASQSSAAGASNGAALANGAPRLSRKRSRDGTQLPLSKAPGSDEDGATKEDFPPRNDILLDRYMQRDLLYGVAMNEHVDRTRALVKAKEAEKQFYYNDVRQQRMVNPGSVFGYGYMGYGNRLTEGKNQLVLNSQRGPPKTRRNRQIYIPRKDNAQQAEQHEELVPLRLDIELDKLRLRDTFTWNLHEKLIAPELFADYLLEDLKLPPENLPELTRLVRQEMRDQIENFYPHIIVEEGPLDPSRPYNEHKDDEMRIQIKLNITIGRICLIDQFEWDINNPLNSPEEFARQMASENALSGEFTTAIAHSIREQSQLYTRSLYLTNHCFDGRPVEDPELRDSFLQAPVHSAFRPMQVQKDWTPLLYEMSEAEHERTETSMMREHRAQKRQLNRRGGPALPDLKDRQRTVRSLIVHSVIPGAVEAWETTGILKTRRGGRAGRRAGARVDGDADSDDLDSDDDSAPDSPAPSMLNAGTARTRGMRGAASAAQAAMRANLGRSQTPDSPAIVTPHDMRTSMRRSMLREESAAAEEESLVVKLKISKAKLRAWVESIEKKKRAAQMPLSGYASQPMVNTIPLSTPSRPSAVAATAAAQSTPSMTPRTLPNTRNTPQPNGHARASPATRQAQPDHKYDSQGRTETDHWPLADETPPPPPPWLATAIQTLRDRHSESDFEPIMRPYSVNASTGETVRSQVEPGATAPAGLKFQFLPRIRCNDCPGKLYTAQPGKVVEDFEVHLRNRVHRERVQTRRGAGRS